LATALAATTAAAGCSGTANTDPALNGAWSESGSERRLELLSDGHFRQTAAVGGEGSEVSGEGTWHVEDGTLHLELRSGMMSWLERTAVSPATVSWLYTVDGDTLTAEPAFGPTETVEYVRTR
jgi:hypothetical protein